MRHREEMSPQERVEYDEEQRFKLQREATRRAVEEELGVAVKHHGQAVSELDRLRGVEVATLSGDDRIEHATATIRTEQRVDELTARQAHIKQVLKEF